MNVITRGIRNAFRNAIRTFSIVVILGLSVGLALAMLVAHQAVGNKISSVKSSVGNTVSISPAGVRGFSGGGNPLTDSQLASVKHLSHVTGFSESLGDRLTSSDTNLVSAVDAGVLGKRFAENNSGGFSGSDSNGQFTQFQNFTPPVSVNGTTDPTNIGGTIGGGTFTLTSGSVFSGSSSDDVALVGTTLASKNNLHVGSTFTAYGKTITVVGVFNAGNTFSNNQLIMPLATVQSLSGQVGDVTNASLTVDSITNVDSVTAAASKVLGSAADVTNASQEAQNAIAPLQNIQSISLYSLIGAVGAGAVIILLTMIMIVRERRREIGALKAIGASNFKVMFQFMTEAVTLTLMGAVIGVGLGVVAGNPITKLLVNNSTTSNTGIQIAGIAGGSRGFGGFHRTLSNITANVGWDIILYGLGAALIIAVVGSAVVSFFIAKVRPAEVMRVE